MTYVTHSTKWLSEKISQDTKDLIARFYELADSRQSDAGCLMANEVFSNDATLIAANGTHRGSTEISRSRDNAWSVVTSRRHTISKVFAGEDEGLELVLLGSVHMVFTNQKVLDSAFVNHVKVQESGAGATPRIGYMEVFADTSPISAILAK